MTNRNYLCMHVETIEMNILNELLPVEAIMSDLLLKPANFFE